MSSMMIIACENIRNELIAAANNTGQNIPILFLTQDAHQNPDRMREQLQSLLDRIANVDMVLLPMGCCGNATKGLVCNSASLVLPRCEDCIDILIAPTGSSRNRKAFYLTAGWLDNPFSIDTEFKYTLNKYGKDTAKTLMDAIYGNYEGFVVLNTSAYNSEAAAETIDPLASMVGIEVVEQEGSFGMIEDMLNQKFDDRFVVVPPGEAVSDEHLKPLAKDE